MSNADRSCKIPQAVRHLFGRPPIMVGENPAEYEQLVELVHKDVQPQDVPEWLLARDIVDAEWELLRLRGMKVAMLHAMLPRAMKSLITDAQGLVVLNDQLVPTVRKLLIGVVAGDEQAKQELERLLARLGLSLDVVTAATFAETIRPQVHTDGMVSAAYKRRNAAYAELEQRREKQRKVATAPSDDDEVMHEVEAPPIDAANVPADPADRSVSGKVG